MRDQLPDFDSSRREQFGVHYDKEKFFACAVQNLPRGCELFRLQRANYPEYFPTSTTYSVPKVEMRSFYKNGMKPRDYFEALCKNVAGKFIYQTARDVKGIYEIRPRKYPTDYELEDRYVLEDPHFSTLGVPDDLARQYVQPPTGKYQFFETRVETVGLDGYQFRRLYRGGPTGKSYAYSTIVSSTSAVGNETPEIVHVESTEKIDSLYGFTWRGIDHPKDREMGVAGAELIVVNLSSGEVLAVFRNFAFQSSFASRSRGYWFGRDSCPQLKSELFGQTFHTNIPQFLTTVLIPPTE